MNETHLGYEIVEAIAVDQYTYVVGEKLMMLQPYATWRRSEDAFGRYSYDEEQCFCSYLEAVADLGKRVQEEAQKWIEYRKGQNLTDRLFHAGDCIHESKYADYSKQLMVVRPEALNTRYRLPENQLMFASHGNGCNPKASGRGVFGELIFSSQTIRFDRGDFIGIIKPECIPEWGQKALELMKQEKEKPKKPHKDNQER